MRDGLAQYLGEVLRSIFTGLTAGRVCTVDKRVLGVGLHHHERDGRSEVHILESTMAEVALHESAGLAEKRRCLIEESARAAGEGMLCLLSDLCELDTILPDTVDLAERKRGAHFKGCG